MAESRRSERWSPRSLAIAALELAALTGAAIAQPLLDEFGRAPDVFIRAGVTRWDIALFALVIALGPVAILLVVEAVVAALVGERARRSVHLALVAALGLLVALHALRSLFDWQGAVLLGVALAVAAGVAIAHSRSRTMRDWLRWAAPLPVIVVVLFLVFSPVSDLVRGATEPASAAVTVKTRRSVVVLLLDEFPVLSLLDANGRIDARRLPNFARLAADSTWFRNTTSVGTHTFFAMPAVMTGRYPHENPSSAPTYADYPDSIFRLLGAAYPANVSEVVTRICAPSYCHPPRAGNGSSTPTPPPLPKEGLSGLLSRARSQYEQLVALHDSHRVTEGDAVEPIGATAATTTTTTTPMTPAATDPVVSVTLPPAARIAAFGQLLPGAQPTRFADWMARITPNGPPTLNLVHLLLPHYPWLHTTSGRTYATPDSGPALAGISNGAWATAEGADLARRRHLLQVGYVDRLLGTLVAHLKATHHWNDTVFVVTADHGVGLTKGGHMRELDDINRDEILGVPLFVHAPGMKPGIDDRPAQNIDAVPTIAGLLGVHIPWKVDGRDLSRPATPRPAAHPVGAGSDLDPSRSRASRSTSAAISPRCWPSHVRTQCRSRHPTRICPCCATVRTARSSAGRSRSSRRPATRAVGTGSATTRTTPRSRASMSTGVVPAYVTGRLENGQPDDAIVGVVNGRVAGVGVIVEPADQRVALVLDPAYFVPGANDVRFFLWRDDHTLAPLS